MSLRTCSVVQTHKGRSGTSHPLLLSFHFSLASYMSSSNKELKILNRGEPTHTAGWGSCPSYCQSKPSPPKEFLSVRSWARALGCERRRCSRGWRRKEGRKEKAFWAGRSLVVKWRPKSNNVSPLLTSLGPSWPPIAGWLTTYICYFFCVPITFSVICWGLGAAIFCYYLL
jgi:hypothetical protein